jgi:hypothetical protein
MSTETKRLALELFEELRAEFPHLLMELDPDDADVEVSFTIPQQSGLAFDVHVNLQNDDELHLCAGAFWCSWFPSSKTDVVQRFHDAVAGVLTGRNRIVEYARWGRIVGADLQESHGNRWKTIARSRRGLLPVLWFSEKRFRVNEAVR